VGAASRREKQQPIPSLRAQRRAASAPAERPTIPFEGQE